MRFSASASFIAVASLSVVGIAALNSTEAKSEQPFVMIPLLFGTQQITEGVIWLTFSHGAPLIKETMTYVYSGFSHVLWPMYVPSAMGVLETVPWRKRAIFTFGLAGMVVGLYLRYAIVTRPLVAEVVGMHIVYTSPHFYLAPVMVLYLASTCVSCFFLESQIRQAIRCVVVVVLHRCLCRTCRRPRLDLMFLRRHLRCSHLLRFDDQDRIIETTGDRSSEKDGAYELRP